MKVGREEIGDWRLEIGELDDWRIGRFDKLGTAELENWGMK